jgi:hypothetical protein
MSSADFNALKFLPVEERGDPRFAPPETELIQWMYTIAPGETRIWRAPNCAAREATPPKRFVRAIMRGDFPFDALDPITMWTALDGPRFWNQKLPDVAPNLALGAPALRYRYRPQKKLAHLFDNGTFALVSDLVLACIAELDPGCADVRTCVVDGLPNRTQFSAIVPKRIWDVADPARTCIQVKCMSHASGRFFEAYPYIPGPPPLGQSQEIQAAGMFLRDDIPENVHLIRGLWGSELLVSIELMELIRKSGATGIAFEPTDTSRHEYRIEI